MTEPRAALFTLTADGRTFTDIFEGPEYPDPELMCEQTRAAVGDDFPGALFSIAVNDEAREVMGNRRMRAMGFDGPDYPEYAAPVTARTDAGKETK